MTTYLTKGQIVYLNAFLIKKYSSSEDIGIKEPNLLDSAINRPKQSAFGEDAYKTVFEKSAALFQSLAQNHPFYNANKRTAYAALKVFLLQNGYSIEAKQQEKEDFTVKISDQENKIGINEMSIWIENHTISKN
ncbi:MAG: type II toxin-antitoxin system death-on-curing family toxin [Bacillus sp. (in: firmicutes)]